MSHTRRWSGTPTESLALVLWPWSIPIEVIEVDERSVEDADHPTQPLADLGTPHSTLESLGSTA